MSRTNFPGPLIEGTKGISKLWNLAENFFNWGGKTYKVQKISSKDNLIISKTPSHPNKLLTAFKILLLPFAGVFMLGVRSYYRGKYEVTVLDSNEMTSSAKKTMGTSQGVLDEKKEPTTPVTPQQMIPLPPIPSGKDSSKFQQVLEETPVFNNYKVGDSDFVLTGFTIRPSHLLMDALFKHRDANNTLSSMVTLPQSGQLFKFYNPEYVRDTINQANPDNVLVVSAKGVKAEVYDHNGKKTEINDLSNFYGEQSFQISMKELQETLQSQHIYTSPLLPLPFYKGLKLAMKEDKMVILPGYDGKPLPLKNISESHVKEFLLQVEKDPKAYGFQTHEDFKSLLDLTIYEIGSMVVKVEDFRILTNGKGEILPRQVGEKDAFCLINACGIRGFHSTHTPKEKLKEIMTETFRTSFVAAKDGMIVFPAIGMGVWRGDPDLYWRSFLDACVAEGKNFDAIFVNPNHQKTIGGKYNGQTGKEFQIILDEYIAHAKDDPQALNVLMKIKNLQTSGQDVVQLSYQLRKAFPDKNVSLFNASDPDVTLGYHVGEYVNNCPHTNTTEENYTAMGTNWLCFEEITQVQKSKNRLHQVEKERI